MDLCGDCGTEVFLCGSISERFNIPISPCWVKNEEIGEKSHAIISDFSKRENSQCLLVLKLKQN